MARFWGVGGVLRGVFGVNITTWTLVRYGARGGVLRGVFGAAVRSLRLLPADLCKSNAISAIL